MFSPRTSSALLLLVLLGAAAPARAATDDPAGARRLLTMLAGIRDEYREALDDAGRLIAPREIEEARLLVAEAREQATKLGPAVPATFAALVVTLFQLPKYAPKRRQVREQAAARSSWCLRALWSRSPA